MSKKQILDKLSTEGRSALDDDAFYNKYLEYSKDPKFKKLADDLSVKGRSVLDDDLVYEEYKVLSQEQPTQTENEALFSKNVQGLEKSGFDKENAQTFGMIFPRVSAQIAEKGVPDFWSGQTAINAGLGALDLVSSPLRTLKGYAESVGDTKNIMGNIASIEPAKGNLVGEIGSGALISPVTPFSGGLASLGGRLGALSPSLSKAGVVTSDVLSGLGSGLAVTGAEDLSRRASGQSGVDGLGYLLGGGLGVAGQGISRALSGGYKSAVVPREASAQDVSKVATELSGGQSVVRQDEIDKAIEKMMTIGKRSNKTESFTEFVRTPEDARQVTDLWLKQKELPSGQNVSDIEGARILTETKDLINAQLNRYGSKMGALDEKYLENGVIPREYILNAWNENIKKATGKTLSQDRDGNLILVKQQGGGGAKIGTGSGVEKEIINQTKGLFEDLKDGLPTNELRALEIRLRESLATNPESKSWTKIDDVVKGLQNDVRNNVFAIMKQRGASPEDLQLYQDYRKLYSQYSQNKEELNKTMGKVLETPFDIDGEDVAQYGGTFLNRLANQTGSQNARPIANLFKELNPNGENPFKTATFTKIAMDMTGKKGSMSGGKNVKTEAPTMKQKIIEPIKSLFKSEKSNDRGATLRGDVENVLQGERRSVKVYSPKKEVKKLDPFLSLMGAQPRTQEEFLKTNLQGKN